MSTFVKMMTDAGDQYLATLSEVQENFVKATSAMSARVAAATPTPAPVVESPFASMLPTPKEMMEASFEFSQKLLKQLAASTPSK
jgi:TRAP-type mannitol/chloroaromatic compound transport system substrate-binding protein